MKKILFFSMFLFLEIYAQQGYNVELNRTYCWWKSLGNWDSAVEAIVKDNTVVLVGYNIEGGIVEVPLLLLGKGKTYKIESYILITL
jgi:hypothetical protein